MISISTIRQWNTHPFDSVVVTVKLEGTARYLTSANLHFDGPVSLFFIPSGSQITTWKSRVRVFVYTRTAKGLLTLQFLSDRDGE